MSKQQSPVKKGKPRYLAEGRCRVGQDGYVAEGDAAFFGEGAQVGDAAFVELLVVGETQDPMHVGLPELTEVLVSITPLTAGDDGHAEPALERQGLVRDPVHADRPFVPGVGARDHFGEPAGGRLRQQPTNKRVILSDWRQLGRPRAGTESPPTIEAGEVAIGQRVKGVPKEWDRHLEGLAVELHDAGGVLAQRSHSVVRTHELLLPQTGYLLW